MEDAVQMYDLESSPEEVTDLDFVSGIKKWSLMTVSLKNYRLANYSRFYFCEHAKPWVASLFARKEKDRRYLLPVISRLTGGKAFFTKFWPRDKSVRRTFWRKMERNDI